MNRKGQQELVGFVAIVIVVSIIGLVVIGLLVRSDGNNNKESKDITNFLESSLRYTSDCAISYVPDYSEVSDLIKQCYSNSQCLDGRKACEVLNKTLADIIDANWATGGNLKGFVLNITITNSASQLLELHKGECTGNMVGSDYLLPGFKTSFDACY